MEHNGSLMKELCVGSRKLRFDIFGALTRLIFATDKLNFLKCLAF
jgi:hypothetical protein